ncbi:MAG: heat-inducible transcriptional repressor HrcA [Rhodospirillales bacterium]
MIAELNERSREVFRTLVETYVETGEPVGSRTLSKRLSAKASPATVRNVMADLEDAGLLYAPHTSAGRLPTDAGLRLFVDGLLEVGNLTREERAAIEAQCAGAGAGVGAQGTVESLLTEATEALSGLSHLASLVFAPKTAAPLKHIEFVGLSPGQALVVLVTETGVVENRVIDVPRGVSPGAMVEAGNYLSARLVGRTIAEAHGEIIAELDDHRAKIDELTSKVVAEGLAVWAGAGSEAGAGAAQADGALIIRGRANLLDDVNGLNDLEAIRTLFNALETKETMLRLLSLADTAEGVQIFIGADNDMFSMAGCSMVVGPYRDQRQNLVGAIGVIGPSRMNYARIIPMVDYTAAVIGRMIG